MIALAALILDGLDGRLARRENVASSFGASFDMETDALLVQVLAILAWQEHKAGAWVLASGLMRYVFLAASWVWGWLRQPLPPSLRAKAICVLQIVALIVAVAPLVEPPLSSIVAASGLAALSYSFLMDTLWLWKHRRQPVTT